MAGVGRGNGVLQPTPATTKKLRKTIANLLNFRFNHQYEQIQVHQNDQFQDLEANLAITGSTVDLEATPSTNLARNARHTLNTLSHTRLTQTASANSSPLPFRLNVQNFMNSMSEISTVVNNKASSAKIHRKPYFGSERTSRFEKKKDIASYLNAFSIEKLARLGWFFKIIQ
jgi:hypothetical protein